MTRLQKRRKENLRTSKNNYRELTDEEAEELNNRIIEYMRSKNNYNMVLDDRPETDIGISKIVHEFRVELMRRDEEKASQG